MRRRFSVFFWNTAHLCKRPPEIIDAFFCRIEDAMKTTSSDSARRHAFRTWTMLPPALKEYRAWAMKSGHESRHRET